MVCEHKIFDTDLFIFHLLSVRHKQGFSVQSLFEDESGVQFSEQSFL